MTIPTIAGFSFSSWTTVWAPLADHIWQSTLFAAVAGSLTLLLRKSRAQTRYWLWFAASAKFLIPFSLLVGLGSRFSWRKPSPIIEPDFFIVLSQPFAAAKPMSVPPPSSLTLAAHFLPAFLLLVWAFGCLAVLFSWYIRWRRMTVAARGALSATSGRELEALRQLGRIVGISRQVGLIISDSNLEPGILGIFRPVLVLPAGISERLTDAQLRAVIIHELWHVRRRDNLAAALHMVIEAIFWFYPFVWWIGARLTEERERSRDEDVLSLGSDPQTYAEGILKVCEFYVESPLFCAAGVTSSKLKNRIEAIMLNRAPRKLDFRMKLVLAAMGLAVLIGPLAYGSLNPMPARAQSKPESGAHAAKKFVLGDLKIQGDVTDRAAVRGRIIRAWKDREFDDVNDLIEDVLEDGVRGDFQNRGYFRVLVGNPVPQPLGILDGKQRILLIATVSEGEQYRLGTFSFQNAYPNRALSIPAKTLRELFHLQSGDVFNMSELRAGLTRVTRLYVAEGHPYATEEPQFFLDDARQLVEVKIRIVEGTRTK
jgi:beta-lactamase regulating signal transducer with metallopeptidase domain